MKCPHCTNAVHYDPHQILVGQDNDGHWAVESGVCPSCKRVVLVLLSGEASYGWDGSGPKYFSSIHKVATRRLIRAVLAGVGPAQRVEIVEKCDDCQAVFGLRAYFPHVAVGVSRGYR